MTGSNLERIRAEVKDLSRSEQIDLLHDLIADLVGSPGRDSATEWDKEIAARLAEVEDGTATTISREEFTRMLRRVAG